jgi:hypothetical protein
VWVGDGLNLMLPFPWYPKDLELFTSLNSIQLLTPMAELISYGVLLLKCHFKLLY